MKQDLIPSRIFLIEEVNRLNTTNKLLLKQLKDTRAKRDWRSEIIVTLLFLAFAEAAIIFTIYFN